MGDANARKFLRAIRSNKDIGLTIAFVHNALGMYLTWVTVSTMISLTVTLMFTLEIDGDISSYVVLGILALFLVLWIVLDNFVVYQKQKYVFTPYIVFIVYFVGVFLRAMQFDYTYDPVNIFVMVHLALGSIALILKIITIYSRETKEANRMIVRMGDVAAQSNQQLMIMQQPQPMMQQQQPPVVIQTPPQQVVVQQQPPMVVQQPQQPMIIQQPQQQVIMQQQQPRMIMQRPQMLSNRGPILLEQGISGAYDPLPQMIRRSRPIYM